MIKIDFWMSGISFEDEYLFFFNTYNKQIYDVILYDNTLFVKAGRRKHLPNENYEFNDNVFKFTNKGKLLYRTGSIKLESAPDSGNFEVWEASDMNIKDGYLYLGYSCGYEAWFDIETGQFLRGQYENRRF